MRRQIISRRFVRYSTHVLNHSERMRAGRSVSRRKFLINGDGRSEERIGVRMTCKYLISICSKTKLPCPYCKTNGECKESECENAVVPTWQELLDIYEVAAKPTVRRMKSIVGNFRTITKALGTTLDAKVTVTDEQIDAAYAKLLTDHQPETVQAIFDSVKATTSRRREIKIEYRKKGKQAPEIDFPTVEKKMKPVVQLTDAQRLAVRERITMLRGGKTKSDKNRFKWL